MAKLGLVLDCSDPAAEPAGRAAPTANQPTVRQRADALTCVAHCDVGLVSASVRRRAGRPSIIGEPSGNIPRSAQAWLVSCVAVPAK